jgi:SAM-dependent methyltransferase
VELLHTVRLDLPAEFKLPDTFGLVCCLACGMAYSDTAADSQRLTAYYRLVSYEYASWVDQPGRADPAERIEPALAGSRFDQGASQLAALLDRTDLRILDVGCASGEFMAQLIARGFTDVEGIDPSAAAVERARAAGRRAHVGDLGAVPRGLGSFDVLVLTHVLEHVGDPLEALSAAREILAPGGLLYVEVPDASRYADYLVEPFNDLNVEHINHFSAVHLDDLLGRAGFEPVASGRNDFQLGDNWPYPAIYGLWRRIDAVSEGTPAGDGGALREQLRRYVEGSNGQLQQLDEILATALGDRRQVAVRCLGYRAWIVLGATMLRDLDVVAFIDADPAKQALTIRGVKAVGADAQLPPDVPVVVLAYHAEQAVRREYAASDPTREVIILGRSRPASQLTP